MTLVAQTAITVDLKKWTSERLSLCVESPGIRASYSIDRLFTSGQEAPGYEPGLNWRFCNSSCMRQ